MEIAINIDDDLYTQLFNNDKKDYSTKENDLTALIKSIRKGTPIPSGHGRIVDIGKIDKDKIESNNPIISLMINGEYIEAVSLDYLDKLQTIIDADTTEISTE